MSVPAPKNASSADNPDEGVSAVVAGAVRSIEAAVDAGERPPSLDELANSAHLSATQLRRVFVERVGVTPRAYAAARRAQRLRDELAAGAPVAEAIAGSGFGSTSRVYERTDDLLGMTPARARKGAPGETIRYAIADTSLGRALVGLTERGVSPDTEVRVCLVTLGDRDPELLADARARFPRARLEPAAGEYARWVEAVVAVIDASTPGAADAVPLDVRGTVFQLQVWSALRAIPRGETFTYAQLAAAIGRPTATRAVAAACGANPTAVLIPCHRVVGSDGELHGYRWGVERKRELLRREGAR